MKKYKLIGVITFLAILFLFFTFTIWGYGEGVVNSTYDFAFSYQGPSDSIQSDKGIDRSIGILGVVASLMGGLIGLVTLVFMLAIAFGILEFNRWQRIREEIVKHKEEIENNKKVIEAHRQDTQKCYDEASQYSQKIAVAFEEIKHIDQELSPIAERIKNMENDVIEARNKLSQMILDESASEELRKELGELGKKIEFVEILGLPLKAEDYISKGNDLYFKGRFEDALLAVNKAIEYDPNYELAWYNKGVVLSKLGDWKAEKESYEKVLEINPDNLLALENLAGNLTKNSPKEALAYLERAAKINPEEPSINYNKACAFSVLAEKESSLEYLSKAIAGDIKFKDMAKTDEDFKNLWEDKDFKKLLGDTETSSE